MENGSLQLTGINMDHLTGLAISIGIGFLMGMERQFSKEVQDKEEQFAGIRTFTMVSLFGFLAAFMSAEMNQWIFVTTFSGVFAFVIISYLRITKLPGHRGATSEFALLITFLLGALVFLKFILFALIIMVVMLFLLAFKPTLHFFVEKLKREELIAIILFVVMSALVIPFLPDNNFGPYDLWNLKEIWQMVVLVSGTSLVGYMIAKFMGDHGTMLAGIVGGLVSSTSVALAFSRKSKETSSARSSFFYAMGIISACTIMFPRILFEVYVVNKALAANLWIPISLVSAAGFGSAFLIYKLNKGKEAKAGIVLKNPLDLSTAIKFALFYAAIQWLVKYGGENFGDNGTYIVGAISGITDVDAITLSMAKMVRGSSDFSIAINTILIAAMSNTLVKFLIVVIVGSIELRKTAVFGFFAIFLTGIAYLLIRQMV